MLALGIAAWLMRVAVGRTTNPQSLLQFAGTHSSSDGRNAKALQAHEKYVLSLVEEYGHRGHDTSLSQDAIDAINTIKDWVGTMYGNYLTEHNADTNQATLGCENQFTNCETTAAVAHGDLLITENSTNHSRILHTACRANETACETDRDASCDVYDNFRQNNDSALLPACAKANPSHLDNEHIQAPHDPCLSNSNCDLLVMEQCLERMKVWDGLLYPLYDACDGHQQNCDQKNAECDTLQTAFEVQYCSYAVEYYVLCTSLSTCWAAAENTCVSTCNNIAISVKARKADNETGDRIVCLLDVLLADNEDKTEMLNQCKVKQYNTDFWDIPCLRDTMEAAAAGSFPAAMPYCSGGAPEHVPCESEWITQEYSQFEADNLHSCTSCEHHTRTLLYKGCYDPAQLDEFQVHLWKNVKSLDAMIGRTLNDGRSVFGVAIPTEDGNGFGLGSSYTKFLDNITPSYGVGDCGFKCEENGEQFCGCYFNKASAGHTQDCVPDGAEFASNDNVDVRAVYEITE